jgi:hypothetical protein
MDRSLGDVVQKDGDVFGDGVNNKGLVSKILRAQSVHLALCTRQDSNEQGAKSRERRVTSKEREGRLEAGG